LRIESKDQNIDFNLFLYGLNLTILLLNLLIEL